MSTRENIRLIARTPLLLRMRKLKLLCLSKLVLIVLHKNTRKLLNHLKQAQKSISNLANL